MPRSPQSTCSFPLKVLRAMQGGIAVTTQSWCKLAPYFQEMSYRLMQLSGLKPAWLPMRREQGVHRIPAVLPRTCPAGQPWLWESTAHASSARIGRGYPVSCVQSSSPMCRENTQLFCRISSQ